MKVQIILLLTVVFIGITSCQPYNDASLNQRISELKDEIEKSKTVTPLQNTSNAADYEMLVNSMTKSYKESVEELINKIQPSSMLSETKIDELNKEVIKLSILVNKLELEKDKRAELEDDVQKFRERLAAIENAQVKVENETLKKHFETQNEILKKLSVMVEQVSNTAPAEVTKQLQIQYEELSAKIKTLEADNKKLEEELKTAKDELEKKDKRIETLKGDKETLEAAMKEYKKSNASETTKKGNDTANNSNVAGMISGKVLELKLTAPRTYTAIVSFPKGTKLAKNSLLQVFDDKGLKIGRFKVSVEEIENSDKNITLVGGEITVSQNIYSVKKGYRVSTMMSMPDITKSGN